MANLRDSLIYTPVELAFGTSGLRGLVTDMTDLECYINSSGFLDFLMQQYPSLENKIFIGGDLRDSTPRIVLAVIQAVKDKGLTPVYCGLIPTPALAYYALLKNAACIMVTGSHIPADRNGIKFYKPDGEVLKEDEQAIKQCVARARARLYESVFSQGSFMVNGMLIKQSKLSETDANTKTVFAERYTNIGNQLLMGKQIVVYQHSAVGRDMLCEILEKLGADIIRTGRSETFIPIDTENITADNKAYFKSLAKQYPDSFAIVSTDGDSDRPFVIDETGEFHRGDALGCLVASEIKADFAALPISSNDAVDIFCADNNIPVVHTKIGSPYVISAMRTAATQYKKVVGWEVNGGFLTSSPIEFMGTRLLPLPTRDAFLPILSVLFMAIKRRVLLSELFRTLPDRYTGGGLIDNIPADKITGFKELCTHKDKAMPVISKAFQNSELSRLERLDLTDGLRLIFKSGDVLHFRTSGNAPQFRVYTNTSSQQQADELAEKAISSGGYIEKLIERL